ncbi:MAG: molybdopterin molybdenumtransferase MoeA, partial [Chloroflexi bacterium]|nr:molybdopterin molybdenumtransferase MoeA [Chloroflexota bacterium]
MPELFTVLPPHEALHRLLTHVTSRVPIETIETSRALNRVLAEAPAARSPLPAFPRSTMDGYAVCATDTFGATEAIPAYLTVIGESPMGSAPTRSIDRGQAMIIHTGGMLPDGADAVVMIERTQKTKDNEIEVMRAVAPGENVLQVGEDVQPGD